MPTPPNKESVADSLPNFDLPGLLNLALKMQSELERLAAAQAEIRDFAPLIMREIAKRESKLEPGQTLATEAAAAGLPWPIAIA
jgi:hypothetical protein